MKEYLQKLKNFHEDEIKFNNNSRKKNIAKMVRRQQKYQSYIIEQKHYSSKISSLFLIKDIISKKFSQIIHPCFNLVKQSQFDETNKSRKINKQHQQDLNNSLGEDHTIDFLISKLSADLIFRKIQEKVQANSRETLHKLKLNDKKIKCLEKLISNTSKYHYRQLFGNAFRKIYLKQQQNPFQSFSLIQKKCDVENENYSIFLVEDKQQNDFIGKCNKCEDNNSQIQQTKQEIHKLKIFMAQKSLQLKEKQNQIKKLKQGYQLKLESMRQKLLQKNNISQTSDVSNVYSKNSSYYSALEKEIKGQKFKENCQSTDQELLSKYMRQCFSMKQAVDLTKEICLSLKKTVSMEQTRHINQILRILSFQQEVSMLNQY